MCLSNFAPCSQILFEHNEVFVLFCWLFCFCAKPPPFLPVAQGALWNMIRNSKTRPEQEVLRCFQANISQHVQQVGGMNKLIPGKRPQMSELLLLP